MMYNVCRVNMSYIGNVLHVEGLVLKSDIKFFISLTLIHVFIKAVQKQNKSEKTK